MSEDKSKLQLMGEIIQADNKNLELIEELNKKEDEIERLNNIINEIKAYIEKAKFEFESSCIDYGVIYDIIQILNKGE